MKKRILAFATIVGAYFFLIWYLVTNEASNNAIGFTAFVCATAFMISIHMLFGKYVGKSND
ncbi:hypothetical protein LCGC14_0692110 [marine sediment metagenome]|uniref:Uncharacterized protein n=1 Tax=marine sediment metagenome TaxID=412755 RepID=A0A0F9T6C1_9ZZZZ